MSTIEQLHTTESCPVQGTVPLSQNHCLTLDDHNRINSVKLSYEKACRLTPIKNEISAIKRIIDRRSALLYSMSVIDGAAMQFITFIRNIPEFELLNGHDRFILTKYNSPLAVLIRICLNYDRNRDLVIDSEDQSEEHAIACKQISEYCYGEPLDSRTTQLFRSITKITDDDPIILQLMMIIMIFAKGISVEDSVTNEDSILLHNKQVYEVQSIYTSLLFRYMIGKYSSYYQAVRQYSQLIQEVIQLQMLIRTYQQFLEENLVGTRDDEINPILKSVLRLH